MRFYIFALLIALAMAQKPGGNAGPPNNGGNTGRPNNGGNTGRPNNGGNTGPPNNGGNTVPPNNGGNTGRPNNGGNTGRPNNGGNTGPPNNGDNTVPPNNGGNTGSPNNGPPKGEPFSCLSSADNEAGKTCMGQEKKPLRFLRAIPISYTYDASSCPPKCILQQLNAIDSSNQVNTEALVAVIYRTNLTDSQKSSATNILKTCLADSATDGSSDANGSRTPAPNPNKGTTGPAGGKNQNGKGRKGKNSNVKGTKFGGLGDGYGAYYRGGYGQHQDDENTGVESESGESNESTTTAPNPNKGTTGQGGKNHKGKKQNGKGQKGKNSNVKETSGYGRYRGGYGQHQDDEDAGVESGESSESSTSSESSSTEPNQSNGGGKNQSGKGPKGGNQNGQGPSGGRDPPPNITPECQASARGVDCLGKALAANDCGPPQRPNGHGQKGRQ